MIGLAGLDPAFVAVLVGYSVAVLLIGYYGYLRTEDEADYLVAGRSVGPIVGGATLSASQISAGTFVGAVGIHYVLGVGFVWAWTGIWTGWLFSLLFVAPQIRRFGGLTVPDFVAARYGDDGADGRRTRALAATLIVVAYTVFMSAQIGAGGLVFQSMFGVPPAIGMAAMVSIAVAYTAVGGMRASVLSDLLQMIVMTVGALAAVVVSVRAVGGASELATLAASYDPSFVGLGLSRVDLFGFALAFGLSVVATPRQLTRFYAIRDEATVRTAIGVALCFQVVIAVSMAVLGVAARVLFPDLANPDLASIVLSLELLHPVLGGLLIAAVFSAMLSTVDSVMIVTGSGLAHDVYGELIDPDASERRMVWANRIAVGVLGIAALALGLRPELFGGLIQLVVVLQASLVGAAFFVPLVLGLHWRGANTPGCVAGMLVGFLTVALWHAGTVIYPVVPATVDALVGDPVVPGVAASLLAFVAVSLATPDPSRETLEEFFDLSGADGGGSDGSSE